MGKAFCLTFVDWSEKRELRERREKVSIFLEQEEKFCSTQIEGKDSNKEGIEIDVNTTAFIASPYGTVFEVASTIFEADFWAWFSRKKMGTDFEVRTVHTICLCSGTEIEAENRKNQSLIFAARHADWDRNLSSGLR